MTASEYVAGMVQQLAPVGVIGLGLLCFAGGFRMFGGMK